MSINIERNENVITYVRMRGDLSFVKDPFNDVDALIFTLLSYFDFYGIVPDNGREVSIVNAYNNILALETSNEEYEKNHIGEPDLHEEAFLMEDNKLRHTHRSLKDYERELLRLCALSHRFGKTTISYYVNELDKENVEQFCAMHFNFDTNKTFIAFRGTDDTLIGWKENFQMLTKAHVAGQVRAVSYLNETIDTSPLHFLHKYYTGGHSKGGNLAMYGCFFCNEKVIRKIKHAYSFDGPGFKDSFEDVPRYQEIKDKITTFTPKFSAIGMCMDHYRKDYTVDSFYEGMQQHDGYSWIVDGNHFLLTKRDEESVKMEESFKSWVHSMDDAQRQEFVDVLFSVLEQAGCKNLSDFMNMNMSTFVNIVKTMINTPQEQRDMILKVLAICWMEDKKSKIPGVQMISNVKDKISMDNLRNFISKDDENTDLDKKMGTDEV